MKGNIPPRFCVSGGGVEWNRLFRGVPVHSPYAEDQRLQKSKRVQLDNLGTKLSPTWRGRIVGPLTPFAVRMQIIAQAEGDTESERVTYVRRRLTALDRALTDDEAAALEEWLLCEELLSGSAKGQSWGDRTGGGSGRASPIPDRMMERMKRHAELKRLIPGTHRATLHRFAAMMRDPYWTFGPRTEQRRTIRAIQLAAAWLASI